MSTDHDSVNLAAGGGIDDTGGRIANLGYYFILEPLQPLRPDLSEASSVLFRLLLEIFLIHRAANRLIHRHHVQQSHHSAINLRNILRDFDSSQRMLMEVNRNQ